MQSNIARNQRRLLIAAALIAIASLVAISVWQRLHAPRQSAYMVGDPEKGAALFFGAKQCATCHSINGSGGSVAPDLSKTHPGTPAMGWLTAVLWNHAPGMFRQMRRGNIAYPHLTTQEMAHVLAFLYQSANAGGGGDPAAGERVFRDKGCAECHSVREFGGHTAPDLAAFAASGSTSVWTQAMWNHAQAMLGPVTKALGGWPQFSGSEMNDLVAFVEAGKIVPGDQMAGNAAKGWQVFQQKCIECHSVRGAGGNIGPALGPEHELPLEKGEFAALLWNHAPAMLEKSRDSGASLPLLQGDEVADLHAFLVSLRYFEPTGSALVGERVFTERGCAHCHGTEAQGAQLGPSLRANSQAYSTVSFTTALWKHGPHMLDRAEEADEPWPLLQPADIGDLVSFLNTPAHK
jgi:mono/diheme cytochrome c family protein